MAEGENLVEEVRLAYEKGTHLEVLLKKYEKEIKLITDIYLGFCAEDMAKRFNRDCESMQKMIDSYRAGINVDEAAGKYNELVETMRLIYKAFYQKGLSEKRENRGGNSQIN